MNMTWLHVLYLVRSTTLKKSPPFLYLGIDLLFFTFSCLLSTLRSNKSNIRSYSDIKKEHDWVMWTIYFQLYIHLCSIDVSFMLCPRSYNYNVGSSECKLNDSGLEVISEVTTETGWNWMWYWTKTKGTLNKTSVHIIQNDSFCEH